MGMYKHGGPTSVRVSLKWADKLTACELKMYTALKSLQMQGIQASYKNLADAAGYTDRMAARQALVKLIAKGLVEKVKPLKHGRGHAPTYIINDGIGT